MLLPKLFTIYKMSLGEEKNANYFILFYYINNFLFFLNFITFFILYIYIHTYIFQNTCCCYNANEVAMRIKKMLMSGILHESGWTLVGNLSLLKLFIKVILSYVNEITVELFWKIIII